LAKILLADDSTHAQRMGAKILAAEGHEVATVSNGQAAIHALEKSAPDLVVADVFMPGRNGYEVCHFIKTDEKLKGIPVLLIIGAMEPYDPEEGRRSGADGLITKPLESSNLLATVKDLLAASKRFAPARTPAPKETLSGRIVLETAGGEKVEEAPQWEETPEEEITSTPPPEKLNIPKELSQHPVGMLTDLTEPTPPPMEAVPEAPPVEEEVSEPVSEPASPLPDPATLPQLDIAEKTVWKAEPAAMTLEEEKLFEQPAANWGDLAQMVEQSAAEPAAPPPLPWQLPVESGPPPVAQPAAQVAPPPRSPAPVKVAADALLEAAPPDMPSTQDALLETAERTVAETATELELESYENLADTVRAQGPIKTMAPPPAPAAEEAPSEEAPGGGPPPSWSGPIEELEAAPDERNVPPAEIAAEAAPETVDSAALEHVIRGVIGELMPQIIAQVKQALKS
jgi:CheY-like chemotaxis protein